MNSEDDTFRVLSRTPFEELKDYVWYKHGDTKMKERCGPEFTRYLESQGWKNNEYWAEKVRRAAAAR